MNFIINPKTKKKVSIYTKKGKYLLKKYLLNLKFKGGATKETIIPETTIDNRTIISTIPFRELSNKEQKKVLTQSYSDLGFDVTIKDLEKELISALKEVNEIKGPDVLKKLRTKNENNLFYKLFISYKTNVNKKVIKYKNELNEIFLKLYEELESYLPFLKNGGFENLGIGNVNLGDLDTVMPKFNGLKEELKAISSIIKEYTKAGDIKIETLRDNFIEFLINNVGQALWHSKLVYSASSIKKGSKSLKDGATTERIKVNFKEGRASTSSGTPWRDKVMLYKKPTIYYLSQFTEIKYLGESLELFTDEELLKKYKKKYKKLIKEIQKITSSLKDCKQKDLSSDIDSRFAINNLLVSIIKGFANDPTSFTKRYLNIMLYGNAGTGKTRYGKIIANVLGHLGILLRASDKTIDIISSQSLIGQYMGQSAPKTRARLSKNIENVMFIDEAYQLATPDPSSGGWDAYGEEVITELVAFLSEYVGKICVIVAGYPKEMLENFMTINQGMPRRFPFKISLNDYTVEELTALLCKFLNDKEKDFSKKYFGTNDKILDYLIKIFKNNKETLFEFNAGDIENLADIIYQLVKLTNIQKLTYKHIRAIISQYCINNKNLYCNFSEKSNKDLNKILKTNQTKLKNQKIVKFSNYHKKRIKKITKKYKSKKFSDYLEIEILKQINKGVKQINWKNAVNNTIKDLNIEVYEDDEEENVAFKYS